MSMRRPPNRRPPRLPLRDPPPPPPLPPPPPPPPPRPVLRAPSVRLAGEAVLGDEAAVDEAAEDAAAGGLPGARGGAVVEDVVAVRIAAVIAANGPAAVIAMTQTRCSRAISSSSRTSKH